MMMKNEGSEIERAESARFDYALDDGRIAKCWQADSLPYANREFSAGLVEGIEPDTLYLRLFRDDDDWMIFLRPDEMQAIARICNGALWSALLTQKEK
jgi:hypothetical protein